MNTMRFDSKIPENLREQSAHADEVIAAPPLPTTIGTGAGHRGHVTLPLMTRQIQETLARRSGARMPTRAEFRGRPCNPRAAVTGDRGGKDREQQETPRGEGGERDDQNTPDTE